MISKFLSATAVVLASSSLVAAQTHSLCNPVKGDSKLSPPSIPKAVLRVGKRED